MVHTLSGLHKASTRRRHTAGGFTLIELLIAIVIIGLIMGAAITGILGMLERARKGTTETTLRNLEQAITLFQVDTGQNPNSLKDLIKRPADDEYVSKKWNGPYLKKTELPRDGWGFLFKYERTQGGKHPYELYSFGGSEGKGTSKEKRISVWDL